jgi:hypothetical protein
MGQQVAAAADRTHIRLAELVGALGHWQRSSGSPLKSGVWSTLSLNVTKSAV